MQEERQLARRIAGGDRQAFAQFVDAYGPRVHRLARRYARTEADAEDVTQEIFLALYRGLADFRGESRLATWVYRVALNHCLKHRERRGPEPLPYDEALHAEADPAPGPVQCAARRELADRVQSALDDLSEAHREVVILHELHGLTYGECAAAMGVPVGTVKSRLSHAFRRLRERLGGYVLETP
ncbi:MAG: sigma-70 family RNA polymerase sigma factor [Armatimonadetes bacterium]|nr:sigma-70 family RNA polymerase sigma factor [Armatimonadota bacterium]